MKLWGVSSNFSKNVFVLIPLMVGFWLVFDTFVASPLRAERDAWIAQSAISSELVELSAGRYEKASAALRNEKSLREVYKDSLGALYTENRRLHAKEQFYLDTIAQLQSDSTTVVAIEDTIDVAEGTKRYTFNLEFTGAYVDGTLTLPSKEVTGNITFWPLPIKVLNSQLPDGSWKTNIEVPDYVILDKVDSYTVEKQPGWFARNLKWITFFGGVYIGTQIGK